MSYLNPVTKKTQEATGFSLSPLYISLILWQPEVGKKNRKPAVFLVTALNPKYFYSQAITILVHGNSEFEF